MSRFNTRGHIAKPPVATITSPLGTVGGPGATPTTRTFEGAIAWKKNARTDLFLRASASLHDGSNRFYESGDKRDETLRQLTRKLAVEDFTWLCHFTQWLRTKGNIRTAALMIACEAVAARLDNDAEGCTGADVPASGSAMFIPTNRWLIDAVCQRADEPGELLAYWLATFGRKVPKPVKRGLADAARRLYNERSLLKYDTASRSIRFGDVLELCHPSAHPDKSWQGDLFKYAIDRRHNRDSEIPDSLRIVSANASFRERVQEAPYLVYSEEALSGAAMTWEDALSLSGQLGIEKKKVWEFIIPSMGYMALLRNLRNFDENGISDELANQVILMLKDPKQVAKSRQLPFRFYTAYKAAPSLRWGYALETALDLCLPNIPVFTGRTLILTDTSGSMETQASGKSNLTCAEQALVFASALALKNSAVADFFQYADHTKRIDVTRGGSVLKTVEGVRRNLGEVGYGTDIAGAVRAEYSNHERVIILSDGQGCRGWSSETVGTCVPKNVPVYLFNLQGYSESPMPTGGSARFDLGGLTDATFSLIPRLEAGMTGAWPWEAETIT